MEYCKKCEFCRSVGAQDGWRFHGCFHEPFKGKMISEISENECPLSCTTIHDRAIRSRNQSILYNDSEFTKGEMVGYYNGYTTGAVEQLKEDIKRYNEAYTNLLKSEGYGENVIKIELARLQKYMIESSKS